MNFLKEIWTNYLVHILDVLIVAFIFYRLMLLIKGTRAVQVLAGLIVLLLCTFLARDVFHFRALGWLLDKFWMAGVLILVVVFQPELRALLDQLGSQKFARLIFSEELDFVDEIISAVKKLSSERIGALIVLEQDTGLRNFVETGRRINGEVTKELLLTIFTPYSPLHDGAVIIKEDRLIAAGCILPLTQDLRVAKILGTRHRAALGITEISDAWAIVVSEENGGVSLARNGQLEYDFKLENLRKQMIELYRKKREKYPFLQRLKLR
jgi:diadenylate cyclase